MARKTRRERPEVPVAAWPGSKDPSFDDLDADEFTDDVPEPDVVKDEPRRPRRQRKG